MFSSKANATFVGLIFYLVVVVGPPLLKLAGLTRIATTTWLQATALLWGPWLLVSAFWLLLGTVKVVESLIEKHHLKTTVAE